MLRSVIAAACAAALLLPATLAAAEEEAPVASAYFSVDSDELDQAAQDALAKFAADRAASGSQETVQITGHGDPGEVAEYSPQHMEYCVGLAQRRANQVRSFLVLKGIKDGDMVTMTFGCTRPVEGGEAAKNRRVELVLGDLAW